MHARTATALSAVALSAAALAASTLLAACSTEADSGPATLRFTAIPDNDTTELQAKFEPVAAYLSEQVGVPVEYVPSSDYSASVELFKNGEVHLAWFGGLTGVQAREAVEGAHAIAQGAVDPKFKSYFIANASTGVERSEEFPQALAGHSFTFGSPSSTSGRLMPEHFLREATGQSPAEFLGSEPQFSGSHDQTALLVQRGDVDAGALNYKTYVDLVARGDVDPEVARIVWVTPDYADYNWTAHPDVDRLFGEGTTTRLRQALVSMKDPALLAAVLRPEGLIPATDAEFEGIRRVALELGLVR